MWLSFSHDTKQNLKLVCDGREALGATLSVLERKLRLRVVEIIGEPRTMQIGDKPQQTKSVYRVRAVIVATRSLARFSAACHHFPVPVFLHQET